MFKQINKQISGKRKKKKEGERERKIRKSRYFLKRIRKFIELTVITVSREDVYNMPLITTLLMIVN